ncbi:MAG: hypothetical protein JSU70_22375 [Phycisphaerales bacterium]|nr:MAG: hypothetical protein JSU70_22375 [Phycisphaerales bacterium]
MCGEPLKTTLKRLCIVIVFGIAFAYIESAVVVYLREIFHPDGFSFPLKTFGLTPLWRRLLLVETGREAATIVLIFTGAWLFGRNRHERFAYFLTIFAVWDIFYYVWLKVLLDWPASIMDWDVLFLIPCTWASPVLCPVLISVAMLAFAVLILYRCGRAKPLRATWIDWLGFSLAALIMVVSFCVAGLHATETDFHAFFYWPLFVAGFVLALGVFAKCLLRPTPKTR